ncbi:MAG: fumarate/nitrate reduction transcriptional regulator Fnr [Gammaproteobacteria bacterium]
MQIAAAIPLQKTYSAPIINIHNKCSDCSRAHVCLANTLEGEDLAAFDAIVKHSKKLNRGDFLYQAGDKFESIYVIRSGSIKTFIDDEDGREQILGFSIQGDVVALDGATMKAYPTTAQALETTHVCEIPFGRYMELAAKIPTLYQQLLSQMSHQIRNEEKHTLLIGTKSAEQRLASLLINFSNRYAKRGFSSNEFNLHMSRRDIGNYLSAAMETVSRLFSRLQANGLIEVHGKLIKIKDFSGLQEYAS